MREKVFGDVLFLSFLAMSFFLNIQQVCLSLSPTEYFHRPKATILLFPVMNPIKPFSNRAVNNKGLL